MLSQSSARIGEVCFLVYDLCMFMLFSERLALVSPKHIVLSRTMPTLLENILRSMFRAWAIDITGQVEWDSFAQFGAVASWLLLLYLGPGPNLSSLISR